MPKSRFRLLLRSAVCCPLLALALGCGAGMGGDVTCSPAPIVQGNPPQYATAGNPYAAVFTGHYNCGLFVCFSLEGVILPAGAEVDNYLKAVLWTPPDALAGTTQTLRVRTPPDACGDSAAFQWTVQVLPAPAIQSFTADPPVVRPGQNCQLTAVFSGGDGTLEIQGGAGLGPVASGVAFTTPALAGDTVFVLSVANFLGVETRRELAVRVPGMPVVNTFLASPALVTQGHPASLYWDVSNGDSLRLDPGGIDVTGLTSLAVAPAADTVYTLTATNLLGESVQATTPLMVVPPPVIDAFTAAPAGTTLGGRVLLTASFRNGSGSILGIGPVQPGVGVLTPPMLGTVTFELSVADPAGTVVTGSLPVTVTGPGTFQPLDAVPLHPRTTHTATLLPDGRVLLAGGQGPAAGTGDSTELFDPATGTFTAGPGLLEARCFHQAVPLPGGKVLLAGGVGEGSRLQTAEVVDPSGGSTAVGSLPATTQIGPASAPLPGGDAFFLLDYRAARYLGASGSFLDLGDLASILGSVAALGDGRVLVVNLPSWTYDPVAGTFSAAGSPAHSPFWTPVTATLADGRVFAGWDGYAELWDPASAAWTSLGPTGLEQGISAVSATLLDGRVLVIQADGSRVYDPASGSFRLSGALGPVRAGFTATTLLDGRVLVVGGSGVEVYLP